MHCTFFLFPYFLNLLLHLHQCIRAMFTAFADYESKSKSKETGPIAAGKQQSAQWLYGALGGHIVFTCIRTKQISREQQRLWMEFLNKITFTKFFAMKKAELKNYIASAICFKTTAEAVDTKRQPRSGPGYSNMSTAIVTALSVVMNLKYIYILHVQQLRSPGSIYKF